MQRRDAAIGAGAVLLALVLLALVGGGMMMGPWMMGWRGFAFNPLAWVVMLLFQVLIIGRVALLAVWLFRQAVPALAPPSAAPRAIEILKERYA